ncbi:MAG: nitronate monooxygenase [Actinomycetota bacterium]
MIETAFTRLVGVRHPIVQTGMGWVSGPALVSATANAGGLGILASATMRLDELERAIHAVKSRTGSPFGVNLRADAGDADERVSLLIKEGVKVASFALAPNASMIARLKDAGVVVMPSIGSPRHAEKVAGWGVDAVMLQGSEGGGHTGSIPTSLLLPAVLDIIDIPVIAAGGYFDGRGLASALAYGAAGIGMGTRFLLTSDSAVPDGVKREYLARGLDGTVVTTAVDGVPHRMLKSDFVNRLESGGLRRLAITASNSLRFKKMSGMSWLHLLRDGRAMRAAHDLSWSQVLVASNVPIMLRSGLVEGSTDSGVLASGQVVGMIDDLPSCAELIERIVAEAEDVITRLAREMNGRKSARA